MTPHSDIPEALLMELGSLVNEMEDELTQNKLVFTATEKALGAVARKYYPNIVDWRPEELRLLAERIVRMAHNYSVELADMDYRSRREEGQ